MNPYLKPSLGTIACSERNKLPGGVLLHRTNTGFDGVGSTDPCAGNLPDDHNILGGSMTAHEEAQEEEDHGNPSGLRGADAEWGVLQPLGWRGTKRRALIRFPEDHPVEGDAAGAYFRKPKDDADHGSGLHDDDASMPPREHMLPRSLERSRQYNSHMPSDGEEPCSCPHLLRS